MTRHRAKLLTLYALFAVSGFCGLIYESIWSHYLKLFVGHAAYAQTLVLAVFMGGMGLGAWLTSRFTARIPNLLWGYAVVELITGAMALAFHKLFISSTEWAYASLLPATCSGDGVCLAQWMLAALLILPQSVLLGSTFPLMSGGVLRLAPHAPGRGLALLYFLNSIGAVLGVLASGFVLIPWIGLPGALLTAGLGNIGLAVAVYFLGKGSPGPAATAQAVAKPQTPRLPSAQGQQPPHVATLLVISALTGLASFIYEVVWIRMLSMVFGSATHSFEIMLASFILGLALGGLWIRRRIDTVPHVLAWLARVQIVMGVLALLTLPLYAHLFDAMAWLMQALARNDSGYALFTLAIKALALAVMLPATFCAGMTLPLITVHLYRHGSGERAIGQVYAANTLGAIAGVLLTVHVLMPMLGLKVALAVGAAIDITLGLVLLRQPWRGAAPLGWPTQAFALVALVAIVAAPSVASFDPLRMSAGVFRHGNASFSQQTRLLSAQDGKTATVHVMQLPDGGVAIATNGKSDGSVQMKPGALATGDEVTMTLLGSLPLAYRPDAREMAVIGFGTGLSSATLLASPLLTRVDTIEIEPAMVAGARHFLPSNEAAYTDPRHHLVVDDAKAYFARGQRRYDAIVSEPSNPWVSGVSGLFTEEFYARVRHHLKPGGVLVQWLQIYEITPELVASVFGALAKSFPVYDVYTGSPGDLIIVASSGAALKSDLDALFKAPAMKSRLERVGMLTPELLALQFVSNHKALTPLAASYAVPANSDFFPVVDHDGPRARFAQTHALSWSLLHTLETPLLRLIDGAAPFALPREWPAPSVVRSRHGQYARAQQLMALVRDGSVPAAAASHLGPLEAPLLVRQRLVACESNPGPALAAPWDGVMRFAAETLPFADAAESAAFWRAARASPCAQRLNTAERRWLQIFEHVALAAWPEAAALATAALAENPSAQERVVLAQVAAAAQLQAGKPHAATQLVKQQTPHWPSAERERLWPRLVHAQIYR